MASTFFARAAELAENIGEGSLRGRVSFGEDSPSGAYAWNQHEQRWINFLGRLGPKPILVYHNGGGSKFLERPLFANAPGYMQRLADRALEPGGLHGAMERCMDELAVQSASEAPIESGDLRASAKPSVAG